MFYGWYIVAASVVIELFGLGFGIFAITTVYPYIIDAFPDWTRTVVFLPTSIIIITVGALGPLTGALIDRYPIRRIFVSGIFVQSLALLLFSRVQTPAHYLGVSALLGLGMSAVTILPNQVLVSRWFHSRVGLVNGIVLAATALGAAIAPALITRIIEAFDWRTAFQWMALVAFAPPMLAVLLVVRDRPQDMGLEPLGAGEAEDVAPPAPGAEWTLRRAASTPTFWIFALAVFLGGMPCYSYNKHILVFLKELGFDPISAADHKSFLFLVSACSRLSFGWLCDRYDRRNMFLIHLFLIGFGFPLLLLVPEHRGVLMPSLLLFGIGYGGLLPAIPILSVHYFGRANLGKILGAYKISYDVAAAGAPLFTAYLYDLYGSYVPSQLWLTGFAWTGFLLALFGLPSALSATGLIPLPIALSGIGEDD